MNSESPGLIPAAKSKINLSPLCEDAVTFVWIAPAATREPHVPIPRLKRRQADDDSSPDD